MRGAKVQGTTFEKAKKVVLAELAKLGVTTVEVEYDGSGDSGDVNAITAKDAKQDVEVDLEKHTVKALKISQEFDPKKNTWVEKTEVKDVNLYEACHDLACDGLERAGIDWYNNEGGYGKVAITVKTGELKLEHNARVESTEYEEHIL